MQKLTRNFSFVNDKNIEDKLFDIEERARKKDYNPIPINIRTIAEYILKEKIGNLGDDLDQFSLNDLIKRYKDFYGYDRPIIIDALFHIKKSGNNNAHYSKRRPVQKNDITGILYLIKALFVLCRYVYSDDDSKIEFTEIPYVSFSVNIPHEEKTVPNMSVNENELKIHKKSIYDWLITKHIIFMIPFYQRSYSWKKNNLETLFTDIQDRVADGNKHYFGVMAVKKEYTKDNDITFKIIDGQQRLTTTILLLKAAYDVIEEHSTWKQMDYLNKIFKNSNISERYVNESINSGAQSEMKVILSNRLDSSKAEWTYGKNYKYFYGKFCNFEYEQLKHFIVIFISKFQIAELDYEVEPSREMDIFENMNSKGTELHEWDLIKNQIFNLASHSNISDNEKVMLLDKYWIYDFSSNVKKPNDELKKFMTEYIHLSLLKKHPKINYIDFERFPVYNNFKKLFSETSIDSKDEFLKFIDNIYKYSVIYTALRTKDISQISDKLTHLQSRINNIAQKDTTFFVVMYLIEKSCEWKGKKWKLINQKELEKEVVLFDTFLIRMEVISGFGHTLRSKFHNIILELSNGLDIKSAFETTGINIKDASFLEKLSTDIKNNLASRMLLQTDSFLYDPNETGQFINSMKSASLEHVMPQKNDQWKKYLISQSNEEDFQDKFEKWLNKLGNFYVLPSKINSKVSNKEFRIKKEVLSTYKNPLLLGNKQHGLKALSEIEEWSFNLIEERTNKIIALLVNHVYKW